LQDLNAFEPNSNLVRACAPYWHSVVTELAGKVILTAILLVQCPVEWPLNELQHPLNGRQRFVITGRLVSLASCGESIFGTRLKSGNSEEVLQCRLINIKRGIRHR
jgi:hypothetical protein